MSNLSKLEAYGVENCHPVLIATIGPQKHRVIVGRFVENEDLHLTKEGVDLLASLAEGDGAAKHSKKRGVGAPVVVTTPDVDDIDLE